MLTISSPTVCLMNLLFTILVTLSLLPAKHTSAPWPPTPTATHSGLASLLPPNPPARPPRESLCTLSPGRATPSWVRLLHTFLKNSWTRPPYFWEPVSGPQTAATEGFPAAGGCRAGLAPWLAPEVKNTWREDKNNNGILVRILYLLICQAKSLHLHRPSRATLCFLSVPPHWRGWTGRRWDRWGQGCLWWWWSEPRPNPHSHPWFFAVGSTSCGPWRQSSHPAWTWSLKSKACDLIFAAPVWGASKTHQLLFGDQPEDTRRWSFGEPYLGEQQGLSMRPWTLSSDVDIWRVRAEASVEVVADEGRGDQALVCKATPRLLGRSVWRPTLTFCDVVCVDLEDMLTIWVENGKWRWGVLLWDWPPFLRCVLEVNLTEHHSDVTTAGEILQWDYLLQNSDGFKCVNIYLTPRFLVGFPF